MVYVGYVDDAVDGYGGGNSRDVVQPLRVGDGMAIVDDIVASIDAALLKSRITGARDLLAWIRDTLVEMTGR